MKELACQSCGMPMAAVDHFGTNADESHNKEYCCFCFKHGNFTDNLNFDEFLEDSVASFPPQDIAPDYFHSADELILRERVRLQQLKRWSSHHFIHQEYYKSVNRVIDYISRNLNDSLTLCDLAGIANLSEFHFHRIFKAVMNESPGDYIQRLRLEKASFRLHTSSLSLTEIAEEIGYQSAHALSKAFKKRFGISPSAFRAHPAELNHPLKEPVENLHLEPDIQTIEPKEVIYTQVIDPYQKENAFRSAWTKLVRFVQTDGIPGNTYEYYTLSHDISTYTRPEHCRIYACVYTGKSIKPHGSFGIQTINGGMYAVFRHKGSYGDLEAMYCNIYRYWVPNSNYQLRDSLHFEKYLNSPDQVEEKELLTDIYIPVYNTGKH